MPKFSSVGVEDFQNYFEDVGYCRSSVRFYPEEKFAKIFFLADLRYNTP